MYKLEATGFPVCPTCSECGRQSKSETGLEHAVVAPNTSANSSINPQFSGPFNPRPPETTTSASAMVTFPVTFSIFSTLTPKSASFKLGLKSSVAAAAEASTTPNEFFANANTFVSEVISVTSKALFEKAFLFTWKGEVETGKATTLEA